MPHSCRHRIAYKSLEKVAAIKLHDKLFSLCWKLWCRFLSCCERATHKHTHTESLDGGSAKSARVGWRCGAFFHALILWLMHFAMCFLFVLLLSLTFFVVIQSHRCWQCSSKSVWLWICVCMCGNWRFASHSDTSFELFAHIWFFDILHNHVRVAVGKLARSSEGKKMISHCVELRVHRRNADCGERGRNDEWTTHFLLCLSCPFDDDNKCWYYDYDYCRRIWPNRERERDGKSSFDGILSIDCNDIGLWFYVTAINFAICSYRDIRCLFLLSGLPKKGSTKKLCTLHLFAQRLLEWPENEYGFCALFIGHRLIAIISRSHAAEHVD